MDVPQLILVLLLAAAILFVWIGGSRLIGQLASQRGLDGDYWFRLSLVISPGLAWWLLFFGPTDSRGR